MTSPDLARALLLLDQQSLPGLDLPARAPGKWSGAEVVEHLGRAYAATAYILEKCAADGVPRGTAPSISQRAWVVMVVTLGYLPSGVRAPAVTLPQGLPGDEAQAFVRAGLHDLDSAAERCLVRFGPRTRVANHPRLGGFTVPQWCRFHWVHTRHHMRQIAARSASRP
ncbi:MAG: DUF1569 domain-containing protein [Luteitalea sp.]